MIDSSSGRDLQYSLDSMSSEDLECESTVTVFGGDLVMSSTCSEDLECESIVTVFGGDLVMSSTCSEDLVSESIVTVFGGDLVMSSTCSEDLVSESIVTVFGGDLVMSSTCSEDLVSESIVTVFGGDLVMSSTCSEDLVSESIVTVFGGDLVMSSTCSEDLVSESIVTVFGGDLVKSSTCRAASMAVSPTVRAGLGDSFREMEIFISSSLTTALGRWRFLPRPGTLLHWCCHPPGRTSPRRAYLLKTPRTSGMRILGGNKANTAKQKKKQFTHRRHHYQLLRPTGQALSRSSARTNRHGVKAP